MMNKHLMTANFALAPCPGHSKCQQKKVAGAQLLKVMLAFCIPSLCCLPAWGAAVPQPSRYDSHMQQVSYNPQNSTVIRTQAGYLSVLVFGDDEAVIGDPQVGFEKGWTVTKDANRVYVRPSPIKQAVTDENGTNVDQVFTPEDKDWKTNLFVTTTKHYYSLELRVINDDTKADNLAYVVTWNYPGQRREDKQKAEAARQKAEYDAQNQARIDKAFKVASAPRNWSYTKIVAKGSENIAPDFTYDDGRFTYVGFSALKKIPSPFLLVNGKEQIPPGLSFEQKGNYRVMVLHTVNPKLILRYGDAVIGLENTGFGKATVGNGSTVSPAVELEEKV
jgi:type IV secretion system protein VirB9